MNDGKVAAWTNPEDRAVGVGAAVDRCSVEISVGAEHKPAVRVSPIGAGSCCAELIEGSKSSVRSHLEHSAASTGRADLVRVSAVLRDTVEIAIAGLQKRSVGPLPIRPIEIDQRVQYLCLTRVNQHRCQR